LEQTRVRADAKAIKFGRKPKLTPHQQREAIRCRVVDGETLRVNRSQLSCQAADDFSASLPE
jgi:hypothetical protein